MSSCARSPAPSRSPTSRSAWSPATTRSWRTKTTDAARARGLRSGSRARRGRPGAGSRGRERSAATTASSISASPPSTSPTAASRAAPRRGAVDAYLYTERGVYRSGETVFVTALLRDAKGAAIAGLPLTLVVAPAGRRRVPPRPGRGPGPRRARLLDPDPAGRHARHLARRGLHRPEGRGGRRDELPRRGLRARAARGDADAEDAGAAPRPAGRDRCRGALSLRRARAPNLDVSGEVVVEAAADAGIRASTASRSASRTRTVEASTAEIEESGTTDAQGPRHLAGAGSELAAARPTEARIVAARRRARRTRGRAQRHAADPAARAGDRRSQEFSAATSARARPRPSTWSSPARTARASRRRGRGLEPLQGRAPLPMVQLGRAAGATSP